MPAAQQSQEKQDYDKKLRVTDVCNPSVPPVAGMSSLRQSSANWIPAQLTDVCNSNPPPCRSEFPQCSSQMQIWTTKTVRLTEVCSSCPPSGSSGYPWYSPHSRTRTTCRQSQVPCLQKKTPSSPNTQGRMSLVNATFKVESEPHAVNHQCQHIIESKSCTQQFVASTNTKSYRKFVLKNL